MLIKKNHEVNDAAELKNRIKRRQKLRDDIDAWILMLPMIFVLYLFIWRDV